MVKLDPLGLVQQLSEGVSVRACRQCYVNGMVVMKNSFWNVVGLGKFDPNTWLSEENFLAPVLCSIKFKHSGKGGFSFKQQGEGPVSFYFQDTLTNLSNLIQMVQNLPTVIPRIGIGWVRQGQRPREGGLMVVRLQVVFQQFLALWRNNDIYIRVCC